MKILFIHNRYKQAGGEDVALEAESNLLKQRNHDVKELLFDNTGITHQSFPFLQGINSLYNSSSRKLVLAAIDSFKPDVIHIHNLFFLASPSVLYAANSRNIPVVFTLHNYRLICCNALLLRNNVICELCVNKILPYDGIKYKCYRSSQLQSALVTAITGLHKLTGTWTGKVHTYITLTAFARSRFIHSSLTVPESGFIVKPNFVEDHGIGKFPRKGYFLFVGRLSPEKGVPLLLESFARMRDKTLFIIGDGPEKPGLVSKYSRYTNISFLGHLSKDRVINMLKEAQALLFPSIWYEGLPFTILEAFSTATPVIASNLGAMAEIVQDGYNGFHFEAGNVHDLAGCIQKFCQWEGKEQMHQHARTSFEEKYHPDIHYNAIMAIYQKAINDSHHA
ncbi:MAG: glycosyltransferase family 4 protein [Chitinophagaceae bacterium]